MSTQPSILPDYKEVKHKNLRLAIIYAKAVIYGNQMPESLRSILSKQLLLPNRLPLNKQKAWSTFIPDSEWLFGGSKETRLTERYTSTNWAYAAKALSQLKVEDEIEVYRSLIEEVIYPARAIQFSLTILEKVFDIKLGISLSDFHGKVEILDNGSKKYVFRRHKISDRSLGSLTKNQKRALQIVLEADIVWEIPHNLLIRFGFNQSRETLLKQLSDT
ncbi:MAG: hypothetical protein Phog2KO_34170 [Phototrophicaceae bacterium]